MYLALLKVCDASSREGVRSIAMLLISGHRLSFQRQIVEDAWVNILLIFFALTIKFWKILVHDFSWRKKIGEAKFYAHLMYFKSQQDFRITQDM